MSWTSTQATPQDILFTGRAEYVPECIQLLVSPIDFYPSYLNLRFQTSVNTEKRSNGLPPTQKLVVP